MSWSPDWWGPPDPSGLPLHYERAPIREAILRFQFGGGAALPEDLVVFPERLGWDAAAVGLIHEADLDFSSEEASASKRVIGSAFRRNDGLRELRVDSQSLSYSWSGPYTDWAEFTNEALTAWTVYKDLYEDAEVKRLSTRFINVIQTPRRFVEIRDYLRTGIDVSPYLPQAINDFFMSVDVPLVPDKSLGVTITSGLATSDDESALVLDLDTYLALDPGSEDLDGPLAELRDAKNRVFEASITDATRSLIS